MDNQPKSEDNSIMITADPDDLKGRYANQVIVTSQEREVVMDFVSNVKIGAQQNSNLVARIFLNRFTVQDLISVLQQNLAQWEKMRYEMSEQPPKDEGGGEEKK